MSNEQEHTRASNPIPIPSSREDDPSATYGDFAQIVGSPEAMLQHDSSHRVAATWLPASSGDQVASSVDSSSQTVRPSISHRSTSSPLLIRRRPPTSPAPSSTRHGITSAILGNSSQPDRQWSLFEQTMENEGQLRSPSTTRRPSRSQPNQESTVTQESSAATDYETSIMDSQSPNLLQTPIPEQFEPRHNSGTRRLPSLREYDSDDYSSDSSDSEDESGQSTPTGPPPLQTRSFLTRVIDRITPGPLPILYRNIFKCSIAYFIASLFTFSPHLSGLMSDITSYGVRDGTGGRRPSPSGHMVATIAVYFNPAKTTGAMLEADLFCLAGLIYSAFVCLVSMGLYWWLERQVPYEWDWLLDVSVIVWIGTAMSVTAWMKVWMANPSFNTACSMTAIMIFVVVVKEGGFEMLLQVSTIVLIGALISNLICFCLWPQSALAGLRRNMENTLESFSVLLGMLVGVFLGEAADYDSSEMPDARRGRKLSYEKVKKAVDGHQSSFTSLKKSLVEARTEWVFRGLGDREGSGTLPTTSGTPGIGPLGDAAGRRAYEDAVDSLNRLAQHLNGLRSGTRLQYELAKAGVLAGRGKQRPEEAVPGIEGEDDEDNALLRAAAAMFGDLVEELGPPLSALSKACAASLSRLRETFILARRPKSRDQGRSRRKQHRSDSGIQPQEFFQLVDKIERALKRFESTSNHAVLRLYRRSDISASVSSSTGYLTPNLGGAESIHGSDIGLDNSLFTSPDNESVFLVYFFIFTLQEFSRELMSLVDAMARIFAYEKRRANRPAWWLRVARWVRNAFSFVTCGCCGLRDRHGQDGYWLLGNSGSWTSKRPGLRKSISAYIIPPHRNAPPVFPKVRPHAPNTIQTPGREELSFWGRVGQRIWALSKRLKERDTKYAIKAGMATALLAAPAFFEQTRGIFVEYWGDWALISFFVVISPTIGATNWLGLQRVLGTLFGATVAAGIYSAFPENPVVLSIFGFFFSLPCFYYALSKPQYLSASRFVLLTYNLTCLYCYNAREIDIAVLDVAFHRALAVTAGVVWAWIVSRVWWPAEARRELGKALGEFCLNIGWLYTRLVASNSFAPEFQDEGDDHLDDLSLTRPAHTRLNNSIQEFMAMELHLQIKLIELQGLLAQAQHEPRLKGPFPVKLYRDVLTSLQTILDKLHSMRCVTTREEWYTSVRRDFIVPVNKERHEMVGNIILGFSVLASAFRLKAPLPPYLPPAEKARRRLVNAIRKLDVVRNREVKGSRQLLFFAYALTMKGVTEEVERLGRMLQEAFGVIGQKPSEFEALFETEGNRRNARTISDIA